MRWNLISMRWRVIFRCLKLVVEYINADEKIHFCLYLMNKMQTNFINVIMQVLFPAAFNFFQFRFTDSWRANREYKGKLALSSFLLLSILPLYFSTFLVSLHNHLFHISIVFSPTPPPPPHLYCFPIHLYHHHICIVFPFTTTTAIFVLFSHSPLQPPYLYCFPIQHYNHHICIVFPFTTTTTTFVLFSHPPLQPPHLSVFPSTTTTTTFVFPSTTTTATFVLLSHPPSHFYCFPAFTTTKQTEPGRAPYS